MNGLAGGWKASQHCKGLSRLRFGLGGVGGYENVGVAWRVDVNSNLEQGSCSDDLKINSRNQMGVSFRVAVQMICLLSVRSSRQKTGLAMA